MKPLATLAEVRSAAALEEEAGWAAWYRGYYAGAIRCWSRAARHTLTARKMAKEGSR